MIAQLRAEHAQAAHDAHERPAARLDGRARRARRGAPRPQLHRDRSRARGQPDEDPRAGHDDRRAVRRAVRRDVGHRRIPHRHDPPDAPGHPAPDPRRRGKADRRHARRRRRRPARRSPHRRGGSGRALRRAGSTSTSLPATTRSCSAAARSRRRCSPRSASASEPRYATKSPRSSGCVSGCCSSNRCCSATSRRPRSTSPRRAPARSPARSRARSRTASSPPHSACSCSPATPLSPPSPARPSSPAVTSTERTLHAHPVGERSGARPPRRTARLARRTDRHGRRRRGRAAPHWRDRPGMTPMMPVFAEAHVSTEQGRRHLAELCQTLQTRRRRQSQDER